ncbi:hypothetical protein CC1G_05502 [Coprinopsis cinerea okayama7|uniref:Aquaporin n=1 Tax=Coprinopsis cinerea (strain Okayama-7 / 130 / ATCC MYA-4618 / FGSC 9003) TaxID=240176 RepID=A8P5I1_COPC7|nr:hypothetical protein CC1G_05502 [Coprinopsis cinerea okayama7\|eukprot:XP_001838949.2 hypothetical protein CC1G_05502 [Coprinopsis cinerea okayama7\
MSNRAAGVDTRSSLSASSSESKKFRVEHKEYTSPPYAERALDGTPPPPPGLSDQLGEAEHTTSNTDLVDPKGASGNLSRWMRFRAAMREPMAEFLGTACLIIFGNGVNCQVVLSEDPGVAASPKGNYLSINVGWGVGVAMGVWLSGGISGGHINPAVTLALATFRGFPWRKVPGYILAQILGGIAGAAVIYGNYFQAINIIEGGSHIRTELTRGLFATYPKNCPPPAGLAPLLLFFLVLGIGTSLGMQTGYAINPARDLGPRILTAMAGYGRAVFNFRSQYWFWCPFLAPILGAQVAAVIYDGLLYTAEASRTTV